MDTKALELEIARLQGLKASLNTQSVIPNTQSSSDDLRDTIRQVLKEELAAIVAPVTPTESPKVPLLAAVGSGLSEEQQLWLSNNQERLSEFFLTLEGQAVTKRFFNLYKEYLCK
jgi:hypothetical protein